MKAKILTASSARDTTIVTQDSNTNDVHDALILLDAYGRIVTGTNQ